jgi:hypothetical protein
MTYKLPHPRETVDGLLEVRLFETPTSDGETCCYYVLG